MASSTSRAPTRSSRSRFRPVSGWSPWPAATREAPSTSAARLAEALTLAIVLPSWHDALAGFRSPALNADYLEDNPDHPEVRDRLLAALRLPPATEAEVLARLLTTAARTVPDGFLSSVEGEEDAAFEPMLRMPAK
ncbi:hypothetical protein ACFV1U_15475 [Streptomyces microflavus]|uniref:hypothetical protein n=1 Tax=Streptomyces microflavus TaxID=1919 RepID=UPI003689E4EC